MAASTADAGASRSGPEAQVARLRADDAVAAQLGMQVHAAGTGTVTVTMAVTDRMTNGFGITHGGYVFLLADTAFAYAANARGGTTVAAGATIEFIEASRAGEVLTAVAEERLRRGRAGLYDVRVTCGDRIVADFRGRSRTIRGVTSAMDAGGRP